MVLHFYQEATRQHGKSEEVSRLWKSTVEDHSARLTQVHPEREHWHTTVNSMTDFACSDKAAQSRYRHKDSSSLDVVPELFHT